MLTEKDIVERTGIAEIRVRTWVERGWLTPAQSETGWVYTEIDLARCTLIRELNDDMEIDDETVPVVLRLIDQVYNLRRELRTMSKAVEQEPDEVIARVRAYVEASYGREQE